MDLKFPIGGHQVSRSGRVKRPVLTLRQPLMSGSRRLGTFIAVIKDPETSEILSQVSIWTSMGPNETVDLTVEWEASDA